MRTVAIIGVGLIGGSLGMVLRRRRWARVLGIGRRRARLHLAERLGALDEGSLDCRSVACADIVVLTTPIDAIIPTFRKIIPYLRPGAIVTDVGSVKGPIMAEAARILGYPSPPSSPQRGEEVKEKFLAPFRGRGEGEGGIAFVGAHPLAGSHLTGVQAARADLFYGAVCALTPMRETPAKAIALVSQMWRAAGAKVLRLEASRHDQWVAATSHLPHAVASALVQCVGHVLRHSRDGQKLLASSFRDVTRVASSDPAQWTQIFHANRKPLLQMLVHVQRRLGHLQHLLKGHPRQSRKALAAFLRSARRMRQDLLDGAQNS